MNALYCHHHHRHCFCLVFHQWNHRCRFLEEELIDNDEIAGFWWWVWSIQHPRSIGSIHGQAEMRRINSRASTVTSSLSLLPTHHHVTARIYRGGISRQRRGPLWWKGIKNSWLVLTHTTINWPSKAIGVEGKQVDAVLWVLLIDNYLLFGAECKQYPLGRGDASNAIWTRDMMRAYNKQEYRYRCRRCIHKGLTVRSGDNSNSFTMENILYRMRWKRPAKDYNCRNMKIRSSRKKLYNYQLIHCVYSLDNESTCTM